MYTIHEIVPNLYLSNFTGAQVATMEPKEVPYFVVNCTRNLPMLCENGMRLAVNDDKSPECLQEMARQLPLVTEEIRRQILSGKSVIVHCLAGQQRSPTVIAAYLMRYHQYRLQDAIEYVRSKKQDAFFWTVNFQASLETYAKNV